MRAEVAESRHLQSLQSISRGNSVLRPLLRADKAFIALYDAHAAEIVAGAKALNALMKALGEGAGDLRELTTEIDAIERRADEFPRQATRHLH